MEFRIAIIVELADGIGSRYVEMLMGSSVESHGRIISKSTKHTVNVSYIIYIQRGSPLFCTIVEAKLPDSRVGTSYTAAATA
eukprot:COSAG02_NODE_2375_length_9016_cov_3.763598_4_plen_82_part_00